MSTDSLIEARRQIGICNACRYCEGYCSVFPAINRERTFSDGEISQLANLCHNCRGCYYACQYTEPHEFSLNLPKILAEVRQESWQQHAFPAALAQRFHRSGAAIAMVAILGLTVLIMAIRIVGSTTGGSFYDLIPHNAMVAIFAPVFLIPLFTVVSSVRSYWKSIGGERLRFAELTFALGKVAGMQNLSGGHGDGCNFEDEDRFSNLRRWLHQAVMCGFLLCFAATAVATIMHYGFSLPAPYSALSLPKILGVSGGILLSFGSLGLALLKLKADPELADRRVWGGEMGFILLLFVSSSSGLALYLFGTSGWIAELLALHLGSVLAFFLLTPYFKMVHGFYRIAALVKEGQNQFRMVEKGDPGLDRI